MVMLAPERRRFWPFRLLWAADQSRSEESNRMATLCIHILVQRIEASENHCVSLSTKNWSIPMWAHFPGAPLLFEGRQATCRYHEFCKAICCKAQCACRRAETSMSTVSVVIPAYNAEPFIRAAIDSVLAQSVPAHEILVIDDGSQDNTPAIVDTYGGIVRLVRQANGGPSRARNHGTSLVTGEFVAFLDADDGWREDKLALQLAAVGAKPEAVLCYTGLEVLLPEGGMKIDRAWPEDQVVSTLRVFNPGIGPSSVMIRRQSFLDVNGFDERLKTCEDWDLWVRLSRKGPILFR